ncbi:MAG: serine protease [Parachlamydia sp.]|nr:serine protease [Parachlamydia sp.]
MTSLQPLDLRGAQTNLTTSDGTPCETKTISRIPAVFLAHTQKETTEKAFTPKKIEKCDIFQAIGPKVCLVESPLGKATGFFVSQTELVTAFHILPLTEQGTQFTVCSDNVKVTHAGKQYHVTFSPGFNSTKGREIDLCVLTIDGKITPQNFFSFLPIPLQEGMNAYFAGFPLTQSVITFHKGSISSIYQKNNTQYFTIDGTVVPGNSGGPVVIQHQNQVYLAGIIFSEVADMEPDFLFIENAFATMRQTGGVGGMAIGIKYPDGKVRSTSPLDILSIGLSVIKRNMSTGIGKALHIQHIKNLFPQPANAVHPIIGPVQIDSLHSELPVIHGTLCVLIEDGEPLANCSNEIINEVMNFLDGFDTSEKKAELYSKCWGNPGTIYEFPDHQNRVGRLDIQRPPPDFTNLQIQIGGKSIATVLISKALSQYAGDQAKMAEVINYVIRKFKGAVKDYKDHGRTIVVKVILRPSQ